MRIMIKKVENCKDLNDFVNSFTVIWAVDIYFSRSSSFIISSRT